MYRNNLLNFDKTYFDFTVKTMLRVRYVAKWLAMAMAILVTIAKLMFAIYKWP